MEIANMNWFKVEDYLKNDDRAIVPLGSTEQHAYLSLATDTILSGKLAREVGEKENVVVFPALPYGMTPYFAAYPGSISLKLTTYAALIVDLLDNLYNQGFRRILLLNGHGGNSPIIAQLGEWLQQHSAAKVRLHDWWATAKVMDYIEGVEAGANHASWMENFPWTRLANVELPTHKKEPIADDIASQLHANLVREYVGDGNFGGSYYSDDKQMAAIWKIAIDEVSQIIDSGWANIQLATAEASH